MELVKNFLKRELLEIQYILVNCFICNLPIWGVRLFLYKLCGLKIGKNSRVMMKVKMYSPHKIVIGSNCVINEYSYLDGRGGIYIGDNVTIATYAKLITGSHDINSENFCYKAGKIIIENNVAVFSDALILGETILKHGVVISAKSFVKKGCYEANGIYSGNPALFIKSRKIDANYTQEKVKLLLR